MSEKGKSMWLRFFRDAGIPNGFDTKYALVFDENRIKMDMLMDLNKECLKDMGITAMGDIIAILKHAKYVYEESKAQAYEVPRPSSSTMSKGSSSEEKEISPSSGSSSSSTSSGPRSVIINSKVSNKPTSMSTKSSADKSGFSKTIEKSQVTGSVARASTTVSTPLRNVTKATSTKLQNSCDSTESNGIMRRNMVRLKRSVSPVQREEVPLQKKVRVLPEQEGGYKIKMPEGITPKTQKLLQDRLGPSSTSVVKGEKKTSVFERLGGDGRVSSSSELKSRSRISSDSDDAPGTSKASVFARLGQGKISTISPASSTKPGGSEFLKTTFEIRQSVKPTYESPPKPKPNSAVYREKTLTTIPSSITRSLEQCREASYERPNTSSYSTRRSAENGSGMRSSDGSRANLSVKSRLGVRGLERRSRSRSVSPPMKRTFDNKDGFRRTAISSKSVSEVSQSQRHIAPVRPTSTSVVGKGKVISSTIVRSHDTATRGLEQVGQVIKQERYRNPQTGKMMIRRTIVKKVPASSIKRA